MTSVSYVLYDTTSHTFMRAYICEMMKLDMTILMWIFFTCHQKECETEIFYDSLNFTRLLKWKYNSPLSYFQKHTFFSNYVELFRQIDDFRPIFFPYKSIIWRYGWANKYRFTADAAATAIHLHAFSEALRQSPLKPCLCVPKQAIWQRFFRHVCGDSSWFF